MQEYNWIFSQSVGVKQSGCVGLWRNNAKFYRTEFKMHYRHVFNVGSNHKLYNPKLFAFAAHSGVSLVRFLSESSSSDLFRPNCLECDKCGGCVLSISRLINNSSLFNIFPQHFSVDEEQLRKEFEAYGKISHVRFTDTYIWFARWNQWCSVTNICDNALQYPLMSYYVVSFV